MTEDTEVVERKPLTDPVPGVWMQIGNNPPVYVPHDKEEVLDEKGKVIDHRYVQGAHVKRLFGDGWQIISQPGGTTASTALSHSANEAALLQRLEALEKQNAMLLEQLQASRNVAMEPKPAKSTR